MLNKLLKHEFAATGRFLVPMYLLLLVIAFFDRLVLNFDIFHGVLNVVPAFLTMAYVVSIIAIIVVTFVLLVMRFYRNLLGDEGYLMFTLPVRPDQLITTKLISSMIWTFLSILVVVISLMIAFSNPELMQKIAEGFRETMNELYRVFGGNATLLIIEFVLIVLFGGAMNILMVYLSIAFGQLFNGHRVLGSFLSYVGIYTVTQIVVSLIIGVGSLYFREPLETIETVPQILLPCAILVMAVISAVYYFFINYIFKRKLNLE